MEMVGGSDDWQLTHRLGDIACCDRIDGVGGADIFPRSIQRRDDGSLDRAARIR